MKSKRTISLMLALMMLLFPLSACAPAVVEQTPAPVETPEPTVEATPEQTIESDEELLKSLSKICANYNLLFLETYLYSQVDDEIKNGFESMAKEKGLEYEYYQTVEGETMFAYVDKWLEGKQPDECIIVFSLNDGFDINHKQLESLNKKGVKTINIELNQPDDKPIFYENDNRTLIVPDIKGVGETLAEYTAEQVAGKKGSVAFAYVSTGNDIGLLSFSDKWDELKNKYELEDIALQMINVSNEEDVVSGVIKQIAMETDLLAVVTHDCTVLGKALISARKSNAALYETIIVNSYASEENLSLLKNGDIDAIVQQPVEEIGKSAANVAYCYLTGEKTENYLQVEYDFLNSETIIMAAK